MEANYDVYNEIAERTKGDIYLGVVGPVRTGKSTFIKQFMDLLVIPNIEDPYERERALDETPQSAAGRTIMTTEPKFVPNEAVKITLDNNASLNVRLVDCVGYMVDGVLGHTEDDMPRMVSTPWSKEPVPFEHAAEIGTKKVINDHSTIGIVIVTDGSITDIDRQNYLKAEEKVINELEEIKKPYIIVLNTAYPERPNVYELKEELEEKYKKPVVIADCKNLQSRDVNEIVEKILYEFPICEIGLNYPKWMRNLTQDHWLKKQLMQSFTEVFDDVYTIRNVIDCISKFEEYEVIKDNRIESIQLGSGNVKICLDLQDDLFYKILNEITGLEIEGEQEIMGVMKELANTKKEYSKIEYALEEVKNKGYGVVSPQLDEMALEKPELFRQGGRFGIKLKASAPSIHLIRADIQTEIAPLVGSEKQSEELVDYLQKEFKDQPEKMWESNIFGKSLYDLVSEGLQNKLFKMPEDAQNKLQETLQRIINEGSGGLICIIL